MKQKNALELQRMKVLSKGCINDKTYEVDDSFRPGDNTPQGIHTTAELAHLLETNADIKFDGIFVAGHEKGKARMVRLSKEKFLEHWKANNKKTGFKRVLESFDRGFDFNGGNLVGDDYVPILGGPFNKQLYLHDSLRMFALGFHAYHHDPIGRGLTHIVRDFTLGRGFRVDSKNDKAIALWRAFEEVNELQQKMRYIAVELCIYGETMIWWLPNNLTAIEWQDLAGQEPSKGLIPRIKIVDPSTVWEIITMPEDIDRVIAYQQVFPTQYNMYSAKVGGQQVPSAKFVIQQIPADQMDHHKVNCVSNEKRGRSDHFPAFGYMKRARDTVNYLVIGEQKAAAWAIDTTIDGSSSDIDAYVNEQNSQPTMTAAGSEFVHTSKITRKFQANEGASKSGQSGAVDACIDMICIAEGIPTSYLGMHKSGGQTRASALVGAEPVTKKLEGRQLVYENIVQKCWNRLIRMFNIRDEDGAYATCEITFPELVTQDRSVKMKDLALAEELDVISHERMSNMISKELQISNYDYDSEQETIAKEKGTMAGKDSADVLIAPLTSKAKNPNPSAVTSDEKHDISMSKGT